MEGDFHMNYLIEKTGNINFSPQNEVEEVLQNVGIILATTKGSVPLDRDFGIDGSYVDAPMPAAKAKLASEIMNAVQKYEPRATITSIDFTGSIDGVLKPRIEVSINGTEESA